MDIPINYFAVFAAAIASMVIGALWYSPVLFGRPWMRLMGMSVMTPNKGKMMRSYTAMFLGSLLMAYVLAHFVYIAATITLQDGLILGFWLWLGFIAPVMLGMVLWEGKPWSLYLINVAFQLVNMLAASVILTLWV